MITILWALLFLVSSGSENSVMIKRMEKDKVQWSDFQGAPDMRSEYDAQVFSGIHYSFSYNPDNSYRPLSYEVHSFINPKLSWSKAHKQSSTLLQHEQLHFDISELYARKMKKALSVLEVSKDPKYEIDRLFKKLNAERKKMQAKYDEETDHSRNRQAQKSWEIFINSELGALSYFRE